jgi:hypothetical protein
MRACPFCAEEIQDAAVVCKHCQRDLPSVNKADPADGTTLGVSSRKQTRPKGGSKSKRNSLAALALVLLVLVLVVVAASASEDSTPEVQAAPAPPPPTVTNLAMDKELVLRAGYVQTLGWEATPTQPNCHVSGHIKVTDGGSKDVVVLVMPADDYDNYINGHNSKVYFQTDKTTAVTLDVNTGQPGKQFVVISNAFSVVSDKTVKITDLQTSSHSLAQDMKRALIYVIVVGVVAVSTTAGVVVHHRGESCAVQVRDHLAILAVDGPNSAHVCEALLKKHPEFWRPYVRPRVTRNYDTPENTVDVVCKGSWPPRNYTVYDVNIGHIFPGSYGRGLCTQLEDHEPASRF